MMISAGEFSSTSCPNNPQVPTSHKHTHTHRRIGYSFCTHPSRDSASNALTDLTYTSKHPLPSNTPCDALTPPPKSSKFTSSSTSLRSEEHTSELQSLMR